MPSLAPMVLDPISAIIAQNWEDLGGWSLFLGLGLLIIAGSFREWWVPGGRYKRLEDAATRNSQSLAAAMRALEKQVAANEITRHFFEETTPHRKRKELESDDEDSESVTASIPTSVTRRSRRVESTNS